MGLQGTSKGCIAGSLRPLGSSAPVGRSLRLASSAPHASRTVKLQQIQLTMQRVILALMLGSAAALAPVSVPTAPKQAVARRGIGTAANAYEDVYSMEIVKADDAVLTRTRCDPA